MRDRRERIRQIRRKRRRRRIVIAAMAVGIAAAGTVAMCVILRDKPAEEQAVWRPMLRRIPQTEQSEEEPILVNWESPVSEERPEDLVAQKEVFGSH